MVLVLARTTFAQRTALFFYFQFCIFLFIPVEKTILMRKPKMRNHSRALLVYRAQGQVCNQCFFIPMSPTMNRLDNEENVKLNSDTQTYHHRRDNRKNNIDGLVTYCFVQLTTCGFLIKPQRAPMCMETVSNPFQNLFLVMYVETIYFSCIVQCSKDFYCCSMSLECFVNWQQIHYYSSIVRMVACHKMADLQSKQFFAVQVRSGDRRVGYVGGVCKRRHSLQIYLQNMPEVRKIIGYFVELRLFCGIEVIFIDSTCFFL